jgi:hypothetical protein
MRSRIKSRPAVRTGLYFLLAFLFLIGTGGGATALEDEIIIINEVLGDPASDWDGDGTVDFKLDEWVEVLNTGTEPLDLSDYFIRDILGEEPHLRLSGVIDPGETAVFYGSDAVAWQQETGASTSGLSINNSGDILQLLRMFQGTDGPEFELVFSAGISDHQAEDDRAGGFNDDASDWILYDALNPYGGDLEPVGTGCVPSPGEPNICRGEVPVQARSFGSVKAYFR